MLKEKVQILSRINREMRAVRQWNNMKAMGRKKHMCINGILKYGLPMGIILPLIQQFIGSIYNEHNYSNKNFIMRFIIWFIVFSIGGCISADRSWKRYEKRYNV